MLVVVPHTVGQVFPSCYVPLCENFSKVIFYQAFGKVESSEMGETINCKRRKKKFKIQPLDGSTHQYKIQPVSFRPCAQIMTDICSCVHVPVNSI